MGRDAENGAASSSGLIPNRFLMAFIRRLFSRIATVPITMIVIENIGMAQTTKEPGVDPVELATGKHTHVFVAYIIFLVLAGIAGAWFTWLVWDSGNKVQAAEKARADALISTAQTEGENAKRDAGIANKLAAQANLRAADLEKEAANARKETEGLKLAVAEAQSETAKARLELARIDPVNLPIKSISAEVLLIIKGDITKWPLAAKWPVPQQPEGTFSLAGENGALVILQCKQLKTMLTGEGFPSVNPGDLPSAPNARIFSMSFTWPSNDLVLDQTGNQSKFRFWIDRNNVSTAEIEKVMRGAIITIPWLDKGAEIATGSCAVTINGSIQKIFLVPKTVADNSTILLLEDKPAPNNKPE